ncbi:MAG: hypothetical protein KAI81_05995 [Candidatus Marinimicrobia bacterium]|nr:hypothetical protein [Candidatus Neomarinimicrobiota bacterium]
MEKHLRLNISLPKSMSDELINVAKELKEKKSHIIARALSLYFDELDTVIAEKRYREYTQGKTETILMENVDR